MLPSPWTARPESEIDDLQQIAAARDLLVSGAQALVVRLNA